MNQLWDFQAPLQGKDVDLCPISKVHTQAIQRAVQDGELWQLWYTSVPNAEAVDGYVAQALNEKSKGDSVPFVVLERLTGKLIGSTRYCNIDRKNRRLEIGHTWYAKSYQRTGVNTQCKFMLLQHAFESLDIATVEFRTHWHNQPSRNAIERIGAKQDGVLRQHRIMPDGSFRDTVVYSITHTEWPAVKASLNFKMAT